MTEEDLAVMAALRDQLTRAIGVCLRMATIACDEGAPIAADLWHARLDRFRDTRKAIMDMI